MSISVPPFTSGRGRRLGFAVCIAAAIALGGAARASAQTFVQARYSVPQSPQTSVALAFTGAQAAGNLNVVAIGWNNATTQVQSVTDSRGNTYSLAAGPTVQPGTQSQAIYYAANIVSSAPNNNTVTVTFNGAAPFPDLRIAEYSGIDTAAALDGGTGASGSGTLADSGSVATTGAVLLVGAGYTQSQITGPGSGYTERLLTTPNGSILEDRVVAAPGSYNATAPTAGSGWVMQVAAFRVATGGPPPGVVISSPLAGANLSNMTTLAATVSGSAILGLQFEIDGLKVGPVVHAPYQYSFQTRKLANGSHSIGAYIWDVLGNVYTAAPVAVNFSNGNPGNPAQTGLWSDVLPWPIVSVHVNLAPDGTVLVWDKMDTGNPDPVVWDPVTSSFTVVPTNDGTNLFCAGHVTLPDGRIFTAGGHDADHVGLRAGRIFDPQTGLWTSTPDMTYRRWYPTTTTLPDGRILVLAGEENCKGCNALIPEIYDPVSNVWATLPSASLDLPYYPHAFVLPDGRVLVTGTAETPIQAVALNLTTQTWSTVGSGLFDAYTSAMYLPGKVLKSGTSTDTQTSIEPSSPRAFVLDTTVPSPDWREVDPMAFARTYHTETLLPDGTVLVTGGGETTGDYDVGNAVKEAELWSPTTEDWTTLAAGTAPRLYHSTGLLLPDATVLVSGGGRSPFSASLDQENAEIFAPPYLFKGPRPVITSAPASLGLAQPFVIQTPDAADIEKVTLVALGNTTHGINMNQRYLPLAFTAGSGQVTATAPATANLAPPGWYMLFLVDEEGVPSRSKIVSLPEPGFALLPGALAVVLLHRLHRRRRVT